MIGQTLAIFLDAYRELNARRLFWITLLLSALFIVAFGALAPDEKGLRILVFHVEWRVGNPRMMYKALFSGVVIGVWLTWAASILALISTAGLFPDFISGGSIDLYLSKPISRWRLFLTKYAAGLIFVVLQVLVVCAGGFLILGWRGHEWVPGIFWGIPIVVCFFSYLFSICVLLGMVTRSTIAAILLTLLCWAGVAAIDRVEPWLLVEQEKNQWQAGRYEQRSAEAEAKSRTARQHPAGAQLAESFRDQATAARAAGRQHAREAGPWRYAHRVLYGIKLVLPKTSDTIELLDRTLFRSSAEADSAAGVDAQVRENEAEPGNEMAATSIAGRRVARQLHERSPLWVIGTSLCFEAVVVAAAGWVFARRDY